MMPPSPLQKLSHSSTMNRTAGLPSSATSTPRKQSGPLLEALNDSDNSLLWDSSLLPDVPADSRNQGEGLLPAASKSSRLTTATKATAQCSNTLAHGVFTSSRLEQQQLATSNYDVEFDLEENCSSVGSTDVCADPLQASSRSLDLQDLEAGSTHSLQPSKGELDRPNHHSFSSFSTNPNNQWQIQQRFSQKQQTTKEYTPAQLERLKLAFQWWNIWKQPSKRQMHLHLLTHASPLRSSDIDLLPWIGEDQRMVHVPLVTRKMYRLQNQEHTPGKSRIQRPLTVVAASPRTPSKSPLRPKSKLSQTILSNTYFVGEDEESIQVELSQKRTRTPSRRPHSTGRSMPSGREESESKRKKKHKRRSSLSDAPIEKKKSSKSKEKKRKKGVLSKEQNDLHTAASPISPVKSKRERTKSPSQRRSRLSEHVIGTEKQQQRKKSLDTTISSLDETRGRRRPRRQSTHAGMGASDSLVSPSTDRKRGSSSLKTPRKDRSERESSLIKNSSKSPKKKGKSKRRKSGKGHSQSSSTSISIDAESPERARERSVSIRSRREEILTAADASRSLSPVRRKGGSRRRGEKRADKVPDDVSSSFQKSPRASKKHSFTREASTPQLQEVDPQRRRRSFNSSTPREDARRRIVTPVKTRGKSPRARDSRLDKFQYDTGPMGGEEPIGARPAQPLEIPSIPMIHDRAQKANVSTPSLRPDDFDSTKPPPDTSADRTNLSSSPTKTKKKKSPKKTKRSSKLLNSTDSGEVKEVIAMFEQESNVEEEASLAEPESPRSKMKSKFYRKDSNSSYASLGLSGREWGRIRQVDGNPEGNRDQTDSASSRSSKYCNPFRRQHSRSSSRKREKQEKDSQFHNSWSSVTEATVGSTSGSGSASPIRNGLPSLLGRRKSRRSSM